LKKNILVSGASGIVGYGILRSLQKSHNKCRLIGTTIYDSSIASAFCDIFEKALPTNHENYSDWLCDVIEKYSIDMIIPGIECDMFQWNKERNKISSTGTFLLLNNSKLIDLCQDKWIFYQKLMLKNKQISIPTYISGNFNTFQVPFLLKPRQGYGSRGIVKINNESEFERHKSKIGSELVIQPFIGSDEEEYTVSAFFDINSKLIDYLPLKRKLSKDGYTQEAQVVGIDFETIITNLAEVFNPIGPTNFQFRKEVNDLKLLEINPRISSATSIRANLGYNESIMSVDYFLNNQVPKKLDKSKILNKRAIRYTEDFIF
jgi:carbamoyl-phosphate synthase large subunit